MITLHGCALTAEEIASLNRTVQNLPVNTFEKELFQFLNQWFNDEQLSIKQQTSGSTGTPKIIELKKEHMVASAQATLQHFNLEPGNTILLNLSPNYIAGKMMLVRAIVGGLNVLLQRPSANPLKNLMQHIEFAAMVPAQVYECLQQNPDKFDLIKTLIIGGGQVDERVKLQLAKLKTSCYITYGMTETITHIATQKIGSAKNTYQCLNAVNVTTNGENRLIINAPNINCHNLLTNDVVKLHSSTEFEYLGRFDNIINSGGIKLQPEVMEAKIAPHIKGRFFVAGLPHPKWGQEVVLIVEGQPKEIDLSLADLIITPKKTLFITNFEETPTQKINRLKTLELLN